LRFDNQLGFFQPSIRGIGTGVTTSGGGSNVGIYIYGFYSPNP
jgi:iron complex outermembrane receptor protein